MPISLTANETGTSIFRRVNDTSPIKQKSSTYSSRDIVNSKLESNISFQPRSEVYSTSFLSESDHRYLFRLLLCIHILNY